MALPLVAIMAADGELAADAAATLVSSCAGVIGQAGCVTEANALAPAARYSALITFFAPSKLRVELRSRADERPRGARDLAFSAPSLGLEHWNSVGLVVAALVADAESAAAPCAPVIQRSTDSGGGARSRSVWVRVGAALASAPGFDFEPWRAGPSLNIAFGAEPQLLYPVLSLRWLHARGQVDADASSVAIGMGGRLVRYRDRIEVDLELAAVAEILLISLGGGAEPDRTFRFRYGPRIGLASSFELAPSWHLYAGVDLTWFGRRGVLELAGERLGAEPRYVPGFEGGLRREF